MMFLIMLERSLIFEKLPQRFTTGKLMQYVPEDGVYVYFRYNAQQTIMCVMNPNDAEKEIDMQRFAEAYETISIVRK